MDTQTLMPGEGVVAGIRQDIEAYDRERARTYRQVMWRVPVFLGILVAVSALLAIAFNAFANPAERWFSAPHVFLYFGTLVAAAFVWNAAMAPARRLRQSFRDRVLPIVFGFVDDLRYSNGTTPDSFHRLPKQAVGAFNRQSFDDVVSGRYDGFPFELYEVTLGNKAGKSSQTVFKGVVTAFETITPFPGLLVATKRGGTVATLFRSWFGNRGLEELKSGQPLIDEQYEFRTDNPQAALPLVTGRLARALQWLGETWPEGTARVALDHGDGFLLLPVAKDFFELPGISTPLDYKTHIEPAVADMVALLATVSLVRKVGAPDDQPSEAARG